MQQPEFGYVIEIISELITSCVTKGINEAQTYSLYSKFINDPNEI